MWLELKNKQLVNSDWIIAIVPFEKNGHYRIRARYGIGTMTTGEVFLWEGLDRDEWLARINDLRAKLKSERFW